jgi:predicted dehydrogenase
MEKKHNPQSEKGSQANSLNRRQFVKSSSIGLAGTAMAMHWPNIITAKAAPDSPINIGVIGCGGRGTGAALNALNAATHVIYPERGYHTENATEGAKATAKNVRVTALADLFPDRLQNCYEQLHKVGMPVKKELCFSGFDAYKKLLEIPEINYIILAEPPHFRPMHLRAAVEAGKHVFMEKPAGVDAIGVRSVIESGEIAKAKGLSIVAGTQRRYDNAMQENVKRVQDGAIGEIRSAVTRWLGSEIWVVEPKPGWSQMEAQLRNWNYYCWLSGDIIVEQFIHSIDLINWVLQATPLKAVGLGGRQVRTDPVKYGNVYDHFSVQYEYPNDITVFALDRQINGCVNYVDDAIIGSDGRANFAQRNMGYTAKNGSWRFRGDRNNPYQTEHEVLIDSIRTGKPINDAKDMAESTLTAIMGREVCYSGQELDWDTAMNLKTELKPLKYEFGDNPIDPVPTPGKYRIA